MTKILKNDKKGNDLNWKNEKKENDDSEDENDKRVNKR